MQTILEKLTAPSYFEVSTDPALWYCLVDNLKMDIGEYKYAVCVQTGQVRRFSLDQLVTKINLAIFRS